MADRSSYESYLSLDATKFVALLTKRQQKVVLDLADQIAKHPFQIGDYPTTDATGRRVENLLLDGYLFSYWVDHLVREVRISEIVRV